MTPVSLKFEKNSTDESCTTRTPLIVKRKVNKSFSHVTYSAATVQTFRENLEISLSLRGFYYILWFRPDSQFSIHLKQCHTLYICRGFDAFYLDSVRLKMEKLVYSIKLSTSKVSEKWYLHCNLPRRLKINGKSCSSHTIMFVWYMSHKRTAWSCAVPILDLALW